MLLCQARAHGTTAPMGWYYRVVRGCKKLYPPLQPHEQLRLARGHGTTAPKERYYREYLRYYRAYSRYYRKAPRYYRSEEQYYGVPQNSNTRSPSFCKDTERRRMLQRAKGKVVQKEQTCTC